MKCVAGVRSKIGTMYFAEHTEWVNDRSKAMEFESFEDAIRMLFTVVFSEGEEAFVLPFGSAERVEIRCCFCPNEAALKGHRMHPIQICQTCASELRMKHLEPIDAG